MSPGESAKYEITVRNAGTLPSTNVRVIGTLPNDTKPSMKTEGGQIIRDAIQWVIPRLDPGEARTFRFAVKSHSTGRRVVVATVADARGQRGVDELSTLFQGTAALVWESVPNPVALGVGKQGTFTIKVRNNGGEAARNVRVEVELPEAVSVVQVTPNIRPDERQAVLRRGDGRGRWRNDLHHHLRGETARPGLVQDPHDRRLPRRQADADRKGRGDHGGTVRGGPFAMSLASLRPV